MKPLDIFKTNYPIKHSILIDLSHRTRDRLVCYLLYLDAANLTILHLYLCDMLIL